MKKLKSTVKNNIQKREIFTGHPSSLTQIASTNLMPERAFQKAALLTLILLGNAAWVPASYGNEEDNIKTQGIQMNNKCEESNRCEYVNGRRETVKDRGWGDKEATARSSRNEFVNRCTENAKQLDEHKESLTTCIQEVKTLTEEWDACKGSLNNSTQEVKTLAEELRVRTQERDICKNEKQGLLEQGLKTINNAQTSTHDLIKCEIKSNEQVGVIKECTDNNTNLSNRLQAKIVEVDTCNANLLSSLDDQQALKTHNIALTGKVQECLNERANNSQAQAKQAHDEGRQELKDSLSSSFLYGALYGVAPEIIKDLSGLLSSSKENAQRAAIVAQFAAPLAIPAWRAWSTWSPAPLIEMIVPAAAGTVARVASNYFIPGNSVLSSTLGSVATVGMSINQGFIFTQAQIDDCFSGAVASGAGSTMALGTYGLLKTLAHAANNRFYGPGGGHNPDDDSDDESPSTTITQDKGKKPSITKTLDKTTSQKKPPSMPKKEDELRENGEPSNVQTHPLEKILNDLSSRNLDSNSSEIIWNHMGSIMKYSTQLRSLLGGSHLIPDQSTFTIEVNELNEAMKAVSALQEEPNPKTLKLMEKLKSHANEIIQKSQPESIDS